MNEGTRHDAPIESTQAPFPWQRGWSVFRAIWPQLVYISMAAIAIPQYLVYWTSATRAASAVRALNSPMPQNFLSLLKSVQFFSLYSVIEIFISSLLALWGYLAWVTAAFTHMSGYEVETIPILRKSLRLLLPRGLLTFFLYAILLMALIFIATVGPGLGLVSQLLLITLFVVSAAAPVLLTMESRSAGQVVKASLSMEYTRGSGMTRWSAYFVLLTYEMLLLGSLSLIDRGTAALSHLDDRLGLPRNFWFIQTDSFPFGIVTMLTESFAITLSSLIFSLFAIMTTSFVVDLKRIGHIRSAIDIKI